MSRGLGSVKPVVTEQREVSPVNIAVGVYVGHPVIHSFFHRRADQFFVVDIDGAVQVQVRFRGILFREYYSARIGHVVYKVSNAFDYEFLVVVLVGIIYAAHVGHDVLAFGRRGYRVIPAVRKPACFKIVHAEFVKVSLGRSLYADTRMSACYRILRTVSYAQDFYPVNTGFEYRPPDAKAELAPFVFLYIHTAIVRSQRR